MTSYIWVKVGVQYVCEGSCVILHHECISLHVMYVHAECVGVPHNLPDTLASHTHIHMYIHTGCSSFPSVPSGVTCTQVDND